MNLEQKQKLVTFLQQYELDTKLGDVNFDLLQFIENKDSSKSQSWLKIQSPPLKWIEKDTWLGYTLDDCWLFVPSVGLKISYTCSLEKTIEQLNNYVK